MPLEFRGLAVMDPAKRRVRFAGYLSTGRPKDIVICQVSAETLRELGDMPDAGEAELLGIFEIHKEAILKAASRRFDEGEHRPTVTVEDLYPVAG